jgi:hypothetical protein
MKLTKLHLALALAAGMFTTSAIAGPGPQTWPTGFPTVVKTEAAVMKCCLPKEKVALACKDCKTVSEKAGEDKKGILGWFKADSTHDCSGCGGKVTVKTVGGGKGPALAEYKHVCSKCGPDSAFTCATHKG